MASTWLIVGASRGIGLEFVCQLLRRVDQVIATVLDQNKAHDLYLLMHHFPLGRLQMLLCDVTVEPYIDVRREKLSHLEEAR